VLSLGVMPSGSLAGGRGFLTARISSLGASGIFDLFVRLAFSAELRFVGHGPCGLEPWDASFHPCPSGPGHKPALH